MTIRLARRSLTLLLVGQAATAPAVFAASPALPEPTEAPILTVSGRIRSVNQGNSARFDRTMLEALGTSSFTTTTPFI